MRKSLGFSAIALAVLLVFLPACEAQYAAEYDLDTPKNVDEALAFWRMIACQARSDIVRRNGRRSNSVVKLRSERWNLRVEGDHHIRPKAFSSIGVSLVVAYHSSPGVVFVDVTNEGLVKRRGRLTFDEKAEYLACDEVDLELLRRDGLLSNDASAFQVLPPSLCNELSTKELDHAIRAGKGGRHLIESTAFRVVLSKDVWRVEVEEQFYR